MTRISEFIVLFDMCNLYFHYFLDLYDDNFVSCDLGLLPCNYFQCLNDRTKMLVSQGLFSLNEVGYSLEDGFALGARATLQVLSS